MSATISTLRQDIDEIFPGVVADRRHLHQHPELGFHEYETAKFVAERLAALGCEDIRTGVAKTGVTALIRGGKPGKVVALRADMDALPILEDTGLEYASQNNGVMHACGHDSHVAMLLGTARMLSAMKEELPGTVKLVFQPAEEGGGGALAMVNAGVLEDPKPDAMFGIHIWQDFPTGMVAARPGVAMVAADGFEITITGKGGHGAQPHLCLDPITAGAYIITALQTIVSRELDPTVPGVVTVGSFHAGHAPNVIPNEARLEGTIRAVSQEQREMMAKRVMGIVNNVGETLGTQIEARITFGAPALTNDAAMTAIVREAAAEVVGVENSVDGPLMVVSEDMSEFLDRVPGCYYFVGSRNEARGLTFGHHHPKFDIEEDAMAIGIETMTRTVVKFLNS